MNGCKYNPPVKKVGKKLTLGVLVTERWRLAGWLSGVSPLKEGYRECIESCQIGGETPALRYAKRSASAPVQCPPSVSDLPQSVDRFDVVRILGKGGMGTVYLARDQRLDRLVAVKVLHAEDLAAEDRRARFMREARTAAAVRHPNVATIYEVGETGDGVPFIVMEYCDGETLSQRMRRRPIEAGEFLTIARQIAAGAAAAHEGGIVHRDLKASNIMIEPTGQVKILDFGLAKSLPTQFARPSDLSSRRIFGTLHYLSPEQVRGQQADVRSDLFSVGVIFFQMATGQLPFNADAPLMVLEKIRDDEPEPFVARETTSRSRSWPATPPSRPRRPGSSAVC